jgi:hypothetical protein
MKNETKTLANGTVVRKYKTIGTCHWTFEACVPVESFSESGFSSFSRDENGQLLATLGSERLPAEIDALPAYGELRSAVVRAWQDQKYGHAYGQITEAFPEAAVGRREYGRLSVWIDETTGEVTRYGF